MAPSHGTIWTPHLIHGSMDRPISRSNLPFPSRDMDPYLIHDSLSPPESWTQAASRSVQSFCGAHYVDRPTTDLQTDRQTDRLTDHATRSVTIGRIDVYVVLRCGLIISGQSNLTTGRTAAARGQFDAIRQVAPVCTLSATCFFGPTCVQIKRHLDRFSRFCTAHGRVSLYFTMDTTFPQIAPSYEWSGPHLVHDSFGTSEPITQTASQSTDHATWSVTIGRVYVRVPAMWANNTDDHILIIGSVCLCHGLSEH